MQIIDLISIYYTHTQHCKTSDQEEAAYFFYSIFFVFLFFKYVLLVLMTRFIIITVLHIRDHVNASFWRVKKCDRIW